jgi:hypothetical protein
MMKKTTSTKKGNFAFLTSLLIFSSILLSACKDEKKPEPEASKSLKINCVTITRTQLQSWVDSGWTKPSSPGQINQIVLQFAGANGGASLQLIGYPGIGPATVNNTGKISLTTDTACTAKPFTKDIVLGNNIMRFDKLGIFDREGNLTKFNYILLTPEQKYPPYINFRVQVVSREQGGGEDDDTLPCPEHCNEPNRDN